MLNKKKIIVTGGCGFLGSHLVDKLIDKGFSVFVIDNLSTGQLKFIKESLNSPLFNFFKGDLLDFDFLNKTFLGCDFVIHLAANADVRDGLNNPTKDLEQNTIVTSRVLEASRKTNVKKMHQLVC